MAEDALIEVVVALSDREKPREAASSLARLLGANDAIMFAHDDVVGRALPARGFPQVLPDGKVWRDLVQRAVADGSSEGTVATPEGKVRARAVGTSDGTVLVLTGITDDTIDLDSVRSLLPLLGRYFVADAARRHAEIESRLSRQSATEASELASKLDLARGELQRALALAEQATRARDEFLATVSHELRTPLTSILGWLQLARGEHDQAFLREAYDTIERNARAQSRLIEDLLDFSRIHAGKLRLEVKPVDLVDIVNSAIEVVRPAADAKRVRLTSILDTEAGHLFGDHDRLQQIVWNLLSNAVKFTPTGGKVQVRLVRVNSHAELSVCDTGDGIDSEFLPYVFDRFSQAETGSTRAYGGLGLGLGIVRHLVELHGGTVRATSAGTGKGATFAVRFPLMAARAEADPTPVVRIVSPVEVEASRTIAARELDGIRVLIVEDNDDARALLTVILRRAGASVTAAENVERGFALIREVLPDLIVSDIEMPGEDGYSMIRRIRRAEDEPFRSTPAIALTAYARSVDRVQAFDAGFQMHITKPVEATELIAAVKSLARTTQIRRSG